MDKVIDDYDFSQTVTVPIEKHIGIDDQVPSNGIMTIDEMSKYIDKYYSGNLFNFETKRLPFPEIFDEELKFIYGLFDDQIINKLLAPQNYSEVHRDIRPFQLFRMEILKVVKYSEISYRKFCTEEYFGRERKQNRRFVRLPLNTKELIHHTELCHFRNSLTFTRLINILL